MTDEQRPSPSINSQPSFHQADGQSFQFPPCAATECLVSHGPEMRLPLVYICSNPHISSSSAVMTLQHRKRGFLNSLDQSHQPQARFHLSIDCVPFPGLQVRPVSIIIPLLSVDYISGATSPQPDYVVFLRHQDTPTTLRSARALPQFRRSPAIPVLGRLSSTIAPTSPSCSNCGSGQPREGVMEVADWQLGSARARHEEVEELIVSLCAACGYWH